MDNRCLAISCDGSRCQRTRPEDEHSAYWKRCHQHQLKYPVEIEHPEKFSDRTGLLKEEYLKKSYIGKILEYDYKGDLYTVDKNLKWVKWHPSSPEPKILYGLSTEDEKGLPRVESLKYLIDYGHIRRSNDNKWYILGCDLINPKFPSIHPSNCKSKPDGLIEAKWLPYKKDQFITDPLAFFRDEIPKHLSKYYYSVGNKKGLIKEDYLIKENRGKKIYNKNSKKWFLVDKKKKWIITNEEQVEIKSDQDMLAVSVALKHNLLTPDQEEKTTKALEKYLKKKNKDRKFIQGAFPSISS